MPTYVLGTFYMLFLYQGYDIPVSGEALYQDVEIHKIRQRGPTYMF